MKTDGSAHATLAFLDFELTPSRRRLLRGGVRVPIGGRAFDLLSLFADRPGEVLSKRVLMQGVWPLAVVEEGNLRVQIAALRSLLAACGHGPCIVNHAGRGYCFTAAVLRLPLARPGPGQGTADSSMH